MTLSLSKLPPNPPSRILFKITVAINQLNFILSKFSLVLTFDLWLLKYICLEFSQVFPVSYSGPSPLVYQFWFWDGSGFVRYSSYGVAHWVISSASRVKVSLWSGHAKNFSSNNKGKYPLTISLNFARLRKLIGTCRWSNIHSLPTYRILGVLFPGNKETNTQAISLATT